MNNHILSSGWNDDDVSADQIWMTCDDYIAITNTTRLVIDRELKKSEPIVLFVNLDALHFAYGIIDAHSPWWYAFIE